MTIQSGSAFRSGNENGTSQIVPPNSSVTITGPYTQSGHVGSVQGTMTFVVGTETGTVGWNLFEIERSINGITGRFTTTQPDLDGCVHNGRFGGVRR
jgi:hypothetical protein